MKHFALPARRTANAAPAADLPLKPHAYLSLRRLAAGRTRHDFVRALLTLEDHRRPLPACRPTPDQVATRFARAFSLYGLMEQPGAVIRDADVLALIATAIPFDADVYRQLAGDAPDRHPRICRACGCSDHDICIAEHDGVEHTCRWVTPALCSHCVDRGVANAEDAA